MPGRDSLWLQGARSVDAAKFVLAEGRPTDRPSARPPARFSRRRRPRSLRSVPPCGTVVRLEESPSVYARTGSQDVGSGARPPQPWAHRAPCLESSGVEPASERAVAPGRLLAEDAGLDGDADFVGDRGGLFRASGRTHVWVQSLVRS